MVFILSSPKLILQIWGDFCLPCFFGAFDEERYQHFDQRISLGGLQLLTRGLGLIHIVAVHIAYKVVDKLDLRPTTIDLYLPLNLFFCH